MPKIPKEISGAILIKCLAKLGYVVIRQTGSHIRLKATFENREHNITIPNHDNIKVGTLNNIISDICNTTNKSKDEFIRLL